MSTKMKPCDMPGCPREIPSGWAYCQACHNWWRYWSRRGLDAWAKYTGRLKLAENRISKRSTLTPKHVRRKRGVALRRRAA